MLQYLHDVKFAVESLLQIIWDEFSQIEELEREIQQLESIIRFNQQRVNNLSLSDDLDDILMATLGHWDSYFVEEKEHYHKSADLDSLKQSYETKRFSISSISSTVLQIAKQGITTTYPAASEQLSFNQCPDGRQVGTQVLRTIIRQGRNQAMHYDEQKFTNEFLTNCFKTLKKDFGSQFDDYASTNKAFEILKILGWRQYADFENDMLLFKK